MILSSSPAAHFEAPASYYADAGSQQNAFSWAALTACSLLGCRHGWVMSLAAEVCHIVLRCSLLTYLGRITSAPREQPADAPPPIPPVACCCHRVHTQEHGWM